MGWSKISILVLLGSALLTWAPTPAASAEPIRACQEIVTNSEASSEYSSEARSTSVRQQDQDNSPPAIAFSLLTHRQIERATHNHDLEIQLNRESKYGKSTWRIEVFGAPALALSTTRQRILEFDRLQDAAPFLNVFRVSHDHRFLTMGFKLFPFGTIQQKFEVRPAANGDSIEIALLDGILSGLTGRLNLYQKEGYTELHGLISGEPKSSISFLVPVIIIQSMVEGAAKQFIKDLQNE